MVILFSLPMLCPAILLQKYKLQEIRKDQWKDVGPAKVCSKCVRFIDFPIITDNLGYRTELSINFITEIKPIALVLCTALGQ